MRVLQFYRTYMPETQGGLEEAIRQICLGTGKHGVEQRVLTLARVPRTETLSLPEADVVRVPLQWEPASCSMGLGMFNAYREQAQWADVVHLHYPWPFADLVHLVTRIDRPVVLTYHSDIIRQRALEKIYAPLRSMLFRKVSRIVATSPNYIETSPVLASLDKRADLIPLGLSPESYQVASSSALESVERMYGRGFFLFVGVLRYYKGLHTLIAAASRVDCPIIIAGDGPEAASLKAQAAKLGASNVQFVGYVDHDTKQALYTLCKAVVFPSCERSEAFGVTLLEGQLHSKPLISCEIGTGTSYVNVDGETGAIIPVGDPDALSAAMKRLNDNPALAAAYGEAGRSRLDFLFSGDGVGEQYARLYREVMDSHEHS